MQAGLLPVLRKVLRLPRLEYTSIMNQGDFLIEVPSDRKDIPRVRCSALQTSLHLPWPTMSFITASPLHHLVRLRG